MQKIAIFGGTFDPVHWGHLLMAETALSQLALDRIIWMPDRCPPHKSKLLMLSFEQRQEMVQRAIADHPAFILSPIHTHSTAPSYAIQTFADLQKLYPDTQWYWILGLDAFQTLPRWHRRQELVPLCDWLVIPRWMKAESRGGAPVPAPGAEAHVNAFSSLPSYTPVPWQSNEVNSLCQQVAQQLASQSIPMSWSVLDMPHVGISSSLIRDYCRQNRSIRYLVPEAVRLYILTQQLYQSDRLAEL